MKNRISGINQHMFHATQQSLRLPQDRSSILWRKRVALAHKEGLHNLTIMHGHSNGHNGHYAAATQFENALPETVVELEAYRTQHGFQGMSVVPYHGMAILVPDYLRAELAAYDLQNADQLDELDDIGLIKLEPVGEFVFQAKQTPVYDRPLQMPSLENLLYGEYRDASPVVRDGTGKFVMTPYGPSSHDGEHAFEQATK
ncbi:hypothetical protein C4573_03345 [Candidatus Woesearchaeota archaeon]|nr:MAG: hypothetical protein C4573_03345 [Candidatus Woesearchaeota archaeon]